MGDDQHVGGDEQRDVGDGREAPLELGFEVLEEVREDEEVVAGQHVHYFAEQLHPIGAAALQRLHSFKVNDVYYVQVAHENYLD